MKERNCEIDIIKALAIILMVYGHTFCFLHDWIYLFHMPVFFMVSGYCWSNKHVNSPDAARQYVFDRIRRLMIPYLLWNCTFILLNNLFVKLNIYTLNPDIVLNNASLLHAQKVGEVLSTTGILDRIYQGLCFEYTSQMAGASWFLYALAFVCVFHCGFEYLLVRIQNRTIKIFFTCFVVLIITLLAWDASAGFGSIRTIMESRHYRLFACYIAYLLGVGVKRIQSRFGTVVVQGNRKIQLFGLWQGVAATIVLLFFVRFGTLELSKAEIVNPAFYVIASIAGGVLLGSLARLIIKCKIERPFVYIGNNTMQIMMLHLLAFKLVSWIFVIAASRSAYQIASYPVIFDTTEGMKIIYAVAGVGLSLLLYAALSRGWKRLISVITGLRERKKYTVIALSALLLCLCFIFGPNIGKEDKTVTTAEFAKTGNVGQIVSGKEIEQRIDDHNGKLSAIRLYMATYNRANDCQLSVSLVKDEEIIYSWDIDCISIPDNTYQVFSLGSPVEIEPEMKVVVTSTGTTGNAVTIYKNSQDGHSGLSIDSKEVQEESLCYRLDIIEKSNASLYDYGFRIVLAAIVLLILYIAPLNTMKGNLSVEKPQKEEFPRKGKETQ